MASLDDAFLSLIAGSNYTEPESPQEIENQMQETLDSIWDADPAGDTAEMQDMRAFFDGKKPSLEEFIGYCAGAVKAHRGVEI